MGETLGGEGAFRLTARAADVPGARVVVLRNGTTISEAPGSEVAVDSSRPGAYRVEVRLADKAARAPWILGNPVYVDLPPPPAAAPPDGTSVPLLHAAWRTEHDGASSSELSAESGRPRMTFQLGRGTVSPFAALVAPLPQPAVPFDGLWLDAASDAPMRVSLQFRSRDGSRRWRSSVYVSPDGTRTWVRTSDLIPVGGGEPFDASGAESVLLVVDLVNTLPGHAGRLLVRDIALVAAR